MNKRENDRRKSWKRRCRRAALAALTAGIAVLSPVGLDDEAGLAVAGDLVIQGGGGGGGGGSRGGGGGGGGYIKYAGVDYFRGGGAGAAADSPPAGGAGGVAGGGGGGGGLGTVGGDSGHFLGGTSGNQGDGPGSVTTPPASLDGFGVILAEGSTTSNEVGGDGGRASFSGPGVPLSLAGDLKVISGGGGAGGPYFDNTGGAGGDAAFAVGALTASGTGAQTFAFAKGAAGATGGGSGGAGGALSVAIGNLTLRNDVDITLAGIANPADVTINGVTFDGGRALTVNRSDASTMRARGPLIVRGFGNAYRTNGAAVHNASGRTLTFIVDHTATVGGTMLASDHAIDVTGSTVAFAVDGNLDHLSPDTVFTLIDNTSGDVANNNEVVAVQTGVTSHWFTVNQNGGVLATTYRNSMAAPNTSALLEGGPVARAAALGSLLGSVAGLFSDPFPAPPGRTASFGSASAHASPAVGGYGMDTGFFVIPRYDHVKLNSHGDLKYDGVSLLAGLGAGRDIGVGRASVAAFFTAGWGDYDTAGVYGGRRTRGKGDTDYYGGALLGRLRLYNDLGLEASFLAGRIGSDYASRDFGGHLKYDSSTPYFGGHLGATYFARIGRRGSFEPYAKLFVMRQQSDSTGTTLGQRVRFDGFTSVTSRVGARYWHAITGTAQVFAGAAWEYEFRGRAGGVMAGVRARDVGLKGHTGYAELGVRVRPARKWEADLSVQGSVGKRETIGVYLAVKRAF